MSSTPTHEVPGAIAALVQGRHQQPHDLLGQHVVEHGLLVRAFRPLASRVRVRFEDGEILELEHEGQGVWRGVRPDTRAVLAELRGA